jgi:hypothetical protein
MKIAVSALSIFLALSAPSSGIAKTASGTIGMGATIVSGNSVSVYLVNDAAVTKITEGDMPISGPGVALASISFERKSAWAIVTRVALDKSRHLLTIDF